VIYDVVYTPRAQAHLIAIYDHIADNAGPEIARDYTRRLELTCQQLACFPARGTPRDDIRPGMRTTSYQRRAVIVFSIEGAAVVIHGVFHGGRSVEAAFDSDATRPVHASPTS
jgi:toxin ParE1/3/4